MMEKGAFVALVAGHDARLRIKITMHYAFAYNLSIRFVEISSIELKNRTALP